VTPARIQRRRTKGWRMPDGAVYVGRGSRLGNPFKAGTPVMIDVGPDPFRDRMLLGTVPDAASAVAFYRARITMHPQSWARDIANLRGKLLACWCALDQPCHADVLLELANAPLKCEAAP
jgi:hypothetical protein